MLLSAKIRLDFVFDNLLLIVLDCDGDARRDGSNGVTPDKRDEAEGWGGSGRGV